jgi:hypothetical protein
VEDGFLLECKFIILPGRSPFIEGSKIPNFIRDKIVNRVADEFSRYAAVINDPNTPINALEVIINEPSAAPFFQELLRQHRIPGRVFYKQNNRGQPTIIYHNKTKKLYSNEWGQSKIDFV